MELAVGVRLKCYDSQKSNATKDNFEQTQNQSVVKVDAGTAIASPTPEVFNRHMDNSDEGWYISKSGQRVPKS